MKQLLFSALLILLVTNVHAQVKIGGTPVAPVPSAVLELDGGTTRGLLLPRMRKMDIDAIVNPAEGLTIYATDEQAVYLRKSLVWEKQAPFSIPYQASISLPTVGFSVVNTINQDNGHAIYGYANTGIGLFGSTLNGFAVGASANGLAGVAGHFYHSNGGASLVSIGKTGLGTGTPEGLLHIDGSSMAGNTITIDDDADPTIQFRKAGINKSYIKQQGNDLVFRPNGNNTTGKVILQSYNSTGWMFLDADGNASVGQDPSIFPGNPNGSRMYIKSNNKNVLTLEAPKAIDPSGADGAQLKFIESNSNVSSSVAQINSSAISLSFATSANRYEWAGPLTNYPVMTLYKAVPNNIALYNLSVTGNIGSGTYFPKAPLHILDETGNTTTMIIDSDVSPFISLKRNNIEKGFIQQLDNDLKIGTVAINDLGRFIVRTNGSDRLWVDSVGYVTIGGKIGPTISGPYKLAVKGKIAATDFNVVASGSWPDYVFSPSYKLRSLEETEAYIKEHKHLPNIPSASVVDKEGFALGDMQKRMMEKIEELTLYLIETKKEINTLKQQVQDLQTNK